MKESSEVINADYTGVIKFWGPPLFGDPHPQFPRKMGTRGSPKYMVFWGRLQENGDPRFTVMLYQVATIMAGRRGSAGENALP